MTVRPSPATGNRSLWFLLAIGFAQAGGVIGYLPLLSLLLPLKVEQIVGEARFDVLTATILSGTIAASVANIAFGWLSDRSVARGYGRRRWIVLGLALLPSSLMAIDASPSPPTLIASVLLFQVAVNAVLAPLFAIQAEEVPNAQKGIAAGLLSLGMPAASIVGAVLVAATTDASLRLIVVALVCTSCLVPLLITSPVVEDDITSMFGTSHADTSRAGYSHGDVVAAALARLLVQVAGNVLVLYIFYFFQSILPDVRSGDLSAAVGRLIVIGYVAPVPISILVGRWSDAHGSRHSFLVFAACTAASGLVLMAYATSWLAGAIGFCLYAVGAGVFLSLNTALTMQVLPNRHRRGRDLGFVNLTNTMPALIGSALAWLLADQRDFRMLMLCLAGLTVAGALIPLLRTRRFKDEGDIKHG